MLDSIVDSLVLDIEVVKLIGFILFDAYLIYMIINGVEDGVVHLRHGNVYREKNPFSFWSSIAISGFLLFVCMIGTISIIVRDYV